MGDSARSDDDRLPWLDSPRPPKANPTSRRARTPLLVLLGLFLASAIAVMAYLSGRSTAPAVTSAPTVDRAALPATRAPTPVPAPVPTPVPVTIAPPAPVVTTPQPAVAPVRVSSTKPRATRPTAKRKASVRRSSARQSTQRPERAVVVHRSTDLPSAAAVPQRRTAWPARPFAGPRGRVIQLGVYRTQSQADAAWWRVARAYPYLATLPRVVTAIGPSRGRPRYYRVRLAAGSSREARALCRNLNSIGRGCRIV